MNIFISWSGKRSKILASALRDWIPLIIQQAKPFMSKEDIETGTQWMKAILSKLDQSDFGIICLTPENLNKPWINFEAGSLAKKFDIAHLCPCLYDIKKADLKGPLSQFQAINFKKPDIKKLIMTINNCMAGNKIDKERIDILFKTLWPELKSSIKAVPESDNAPEVKRTDRDILEEILLRVRTLSNDSDLPLNGELRQKKCTNPNGCDGIMFYDNTTMEFYCPKCKHVD